MNYYLYILLLFTFMSCDKEPSAIEQDTFIDTVKTGDTVKIKTDVVLPADHTEVKDSH
jgi:hypothetical protein